MVLSTGPSEKGDQSTSSAPLPLSQRSSREMRRSMMALARIIATYSVEVYATERKSSSWLA